VQGVLEFHRKLIPLTHTLLAIKKFCCRRDQMPPDHVIRLDCEDRYEPHMKLLADIPDGWLFLWPKDPKNWPYENVLTVMMILVMMSRSNIEMTTPSIFLAMILIQAEYLS
jgi:hypothetical protein